MKLKINEYGINEFSHLQLSIHYLLIIEIIVSPTPPPGIRASQHPRCTVPIATVSRILLQELL